MRIWNRDVGFKGLLLVLVCLGATSPFSWTAENKKAVLVRELKKDSTRPVDLSSDGRLILTIGERKNPELRGARLSVLAVYETNKGKIVGKPVIEAERKFTAAIFDGPQRVLALEIFYPRLSSPALLLEWDFVSGKFSERPVRLGNEFMPTCILNNHQFLGLAYDRENRRSEVAQELLTVTEENGVRILRQPSTASSYKWPRFHALSTLLGDNCSAWRSGDNILLANTKPGDLRWISLQPDKDSVRCHSFPGEIICGQAVSPDGSLIAVVTIDRDLNKLTAVAEVPPVFLNLLQAQTCKPVSRSLLEFPEKPIWHRNFLSRNKYLDNRLFLHQLASRIAISPDNSKLALAYGIYKSSDGDAYFGLYSLPDGRRLATLRGNKNRGGFWRGILSEGWASSAPISGMLRFSPDSRMLYAGSEGVFQWDISGLR